MPSKSKKQRRFMAIAAHDPAFAKKAGIPQHVAQEFHAADKSMQAQHKKAMAAHGKHRGR